MAFVVWFMAAFLFSGAMSKRFKVTEEMKSMGKVLHDNCVEEVGTPEALISEAAKGNFADDEKLKCYMKCLFTSTSIMDDDGNVDTEIMKAMIPPDHLDEVLKVMEACKDVTGPNACQKAYNMHVCTHKYSPDDYFII